MTIPTTRGESPQTASQGFALVVTLSITALLVILVSGLLLLVRSQVGGLNSRVQGSQAETNARVSLRLALGAVQKELGNDQRATAPGSLSVDAQHPSLVGVWDSRSLAPESAANQSPEDRRAGRPLRESELKNTLASDHYNQETGFRRWLVSGAEADTPETRVAGEDFGFASSGNFVDPVTFRRAQSGGPSTGDPVTELAADRLKVPGAQSESRFAWLVEEETTKVPLMQPLQVPGQDASSLSTSDALLASGLPGNRGFEFLPELQPLGSSGNSDAWDRAITKETLNLAANVSDEQQMAQLSGQVSLNSRTLLTNAVMGGMRGDLSLLTAMDPLGSDFPFRRIESSASRFPVSPSAVEYNLSRLSETIPGLAQEEDLGRERGRGLDTLPLNQLIAWEKIANMAANPSGAAAINNDGDQLKMGPNQFPRIDLMSDRAIVDAHWRGDGMWVRTLPRVIRMREVLFVNAKSHDGGQTYVLIFYSMPIVTLWNPYNVEISLNEMYLQYKSLPLTITIRNSKGSFEQPLQNLYDSFGGNGRAMKLWFGNSPIQGATGTPNPPLAPLVLKPGEMRVLFADTSYFKAHGWPPTTAREFHMTTKWPDFTKVGNFWMVEISNDKANFKGRASEQVTLGIKSDPTPTQWQETHRNDGWFRATITNATKVHDWNWNLSAFKDFLSTEGGESLQTTYGVLSIRHSRGQQVPLGIADMGLKTIDDEVTLPGGQQPGLGFAFDYPQQFQSPMAYRGMEIPDPANVSPALAAGSQRAALNEFRFIPLRGSTEFSKFISTAVGPNSTELDFQGTSHGFKGSNYLVGAELPLVPSRNLMHLQHLPLQDEEWSHDAPLPITPLWTNTIGNARAHPWLKPDVLTETRTLGPLDTPKRGTRSNGGRQPVAGGFDGPSVVVDRQWAVNSILHDGWFFSGIAPQRGGYFALDGTERGASQILAEALDRVKNLPGDRYEFFGNAPLALAQRPLFASGGDFPAPDAWARIAAYLSIRGGFNINSTSVKAWEAVLGASLGKPMPRMTANGTVDQESVEGVAFSRFAVPIGPNLDGGGDFYKDGFTGYRELSKDQITKLAEAIVRRVRERGPFRSLGEFVNRRRVGGASDPAVLRGVVEDALEDSAVDINSRYRDSQFTQSNFPDVPFVNPEAVKGSRFRGIPGYLGQADILSPLSPIMTCRGDTFTIYAQGEVGPLPSSSSNRGNEGDARRVRYEVVVQRYPDYLDPGVSPHITTEQLRSNSDPVNNSVSDEQYEVAKTFGRRFRVVSIRQILPEN